MQTAVHQLRTCGTAQQAHGQLGVPQLQGRVNEQHQRVQLQVAAQAAHGQQGLCSERGSGVQCARGSEGRTCAVCGCGMAIVAAMACSPQKWLSAAPTPSRQVTSACASSAAVAAGPDGTCSSSAWLVGATVHRSIPLRPAGHPAPLLPQLAKQAAGGALGSRTAAPTRRPKGLPSSPSWPSWPSGPSPPSSES